MRNVSGWPFPLVTGFFRSAVIAGSAVVAASLFLSGCNTAPLSFMDPQGPVAAAQKAHLHKMTAITLTVVVPVLVLVPLIAWRYRRRNRSARYAPDWEYSGWLELAMWGVPCVVVLVLATQLWRNTLALDPYAAVAPNRPLQVQVIGLDWKWLFVYPELGIASVGELGVPTGTPLSLTLTSDSVMQSFVISALGSQIYTMPGMQTRLNLLASRPGELPGRNTQYTGRGFHKQTFVVRALPPAAFEEWVERVRADGVPLEASAYAVLGRRSLPEEAAKALGTPSMPAGLVYFSSVPKGWFESVMAKYLSGHPVHTEAQPGAPAFSPHTGAGATR